MTNEQWEQLLSVIDGYLLESPPIGFIIDSPWLPGWSGISILDYYTSEKKWFEANKKAITQWPSVMFLPGYWAEYGMCTEPSAFGARCMWYENEFPFAEKVMENMDQVHRLTSPDPKRDGLAPFVIKRLEHVRPLIEQSGHEIRFAVARGPLNIAGFLLGNTEFLMGMKMQPDETHALLNLITDYLADWLKVQAERFPTIDGILLLDDVVGFCGEDDFIEYAKPYLSRLFNALDVRVRLFHNDAPGLVCAPHLASIGINIFNFSHEHSIEQMRKGVGDSVTLLGNLPPRDVLAQGTPNEVANQTRNILDSINDKHRIILSCGGGMPPGVKTENINSFIETASVW